MNRSIRCVPTALSRSPIVGLVERGHRRQCKPLEIPPVTTEFAPSAPSPICAPPRTATPSPIQTLLPMLTVLSFERGRRVGYFR